MSKTSEDYLRSKDHKINYFCYVDRVLRSIETREQLYVFMAWCIVIDDPHVYMTEETLVNRIKRLTTRDIK